MARSLRHIFSAFYPTVAPAGEDVVQMMGKSSPWSRAGRP